MKGFYRMKCIYALSLPLLIIITGCQTNFESSNKTTSTPTPLSTTSKVVVSDSMQLIGTYSNQSEQISLYNATDGVVVKSSSDKGNTWSDTVSLPFKQDWEKQIKAGNVYTSLQSSLSPRWILVTSDPALGLMNKSLYESSDNGKTWIFISEFHLLSMDMLRESPFTRRPMDGFQQPIIKIQPWSLYTVLKMGERHGYSKRSQYRKDISMEMLMLQYLI